MTYSNSVGYILGAFKDYSDSIAVVWKDKQYTYSHILARVDHWTIKLHDIAPGSIVGLESDFSPETIAILFALIQLNQIIVPLDIHHSEKNQKKNGVAQLDYFIKVNTETDISITNLPSSDAKNALYNIIKERKVPGLVLFTSGSSGEPKGAVHDLSKLLAKFSVKRKALLTINFLLFDHWGGLNTLFHVLSNGGTIVILENRSPDYVCELIDRYKVELLPTSPTFLNMLILSRAYLRKPISSLKIISYGAEPMPESLLKQLNTLFPDIKLQQTYGLIELGVMRSQSQDNSSLWVKIGGEGYDTRVVDGMLQIKSNSAMVGYLNAVSPFTEDGWFMTGDSVEVDGDYFKILGRKSELINVGGEKVFPQEIENVILEVPGVVDVIVYGESHKFTGKIVCAKIKYEGNESKLEIIKIIKTHCRRKLESYKVPMKLDLVDTTFESDRFKKSRVNGNTI